MGRSDFLYKGFLQRLGHEPTPCQASLLRKTADFISSDDEDILVVNGYAGTGKTTAVSSVISVLKEYETKCVLLAPTGRAAKVLSMYAGQPAYTIHKHIYRQKSVGGDGFGQFSLSPNKDKDTLFVVDEVSLIGIDSGQQQSTAFFGTGNLLEDLISFVRNGTGCKVILIGDSAQLPPVGLDASPALLKDYMAMMGGVTFAELSTVVRQQKESGILHNATMVRHSISSLENGIGVMNVSDLALEVSGFEDIERISGGELVEKISDAYASYGEDEVIILCRSNKRAIKYNLGIRSTVQFKEDRLVRDDKLMIVKNCYQFLEGVKGMDYIANGDIARLEKISKFEERYGLHFAEARISFPDYDDQEIVAKVILDTLEAESASLTYEQSNMLYQGVNEDYSHITAKRKRYDAVREDKYYNALQLKYANAITCHKSQGGQWDCVFIDNPFWQEELTADDLKWLYTAVTRAKKKVYLVNFKDELFREQI
ncbi:MAG: ATP-dependent endonuclease [Bacteroidales bacterium]|nr:ATP-dependent endonuclease [Bacteroidales bacterium]